jgi:hypothetical protein
MMVHHIAVKFQATKTMTEGHLIEGFRRYLQIATMASLFVKEKLVDPYIIAIDSTLLRAKGHLWHKSSIVKGLVPRSGIDTDARWGFFSNQGVLILPFQGV